MLPSMLGASRKQWVGFGLLVVAAMILFVGTFAALLTIVSQSCGC